MPLNLNNNSGEKVIDPYKHKEKYFKWKKTKKLNGISTPNSEIIIKYLDDMEKGINVSNKVKRGARSYIRLNSLRSRIPKVASLFEQHTKKDKITEVTEEEAHSLFGAMCNGEIKKNDKKPYKSVTDYVKIFKAFWRWYMKYMKKQGVVIDDITVDLDSSYKEKPKFVYFTFAELKKMADRCKYDYKILMYFLFDTGIRCPTELMNVKAKDITKMDKSDKLQLNIREETAKTFGRKFKLMLCSELIKEYIESKKLRPDDFLFTTAPKTVNQYLTKKGYEVLGEGECKTVKRNGKEVKLIRSGLTMYDFRHSSSCYWLPRYKSESALKYRFGWKKSDQIHYYTEFLGMKDTIEDEDMYIDVTKTELEKELEKQKQATTITEERMKAMETSFTDFKDKVKLLLEAGMIKK